MIPVPHGWSVSDLHRGMLLVHPEGDEVAAIRYRERAGTPRRLGAIVTDVAAALDGPHDVGPSERLVTAEGELAALVTLRVRELFAHVGVVFTDDFYSLTVGYTREHVDEVRALVRELVRNDNHALGVRRRRFEYTPPRGWQPLPRGLSTSWIPPEFPSRSTRILVYPANPMAVVGRTDVDGVFSQLAETGWDVIDAKAPQSGTTRTDLAYESRELVCARGPLTRRHRFVVAHDSQYQYPIELWTAQRDDDSHAALAALLDSITPLAPPIVTSPALACWSD